jgi:response regulator RpfG family c-di-GMP phosphodiesterase
MTSLNHAYRNNDHRRILLIDQNRTKQELRATILRNYEIEVHTASTITEAATLWTAYSYDLVLVAAQEKSEEALAVTAQIWGIKPGQRIGLLVGPPIFVQELGGRRRKAASAVRTWPSRVVEDSNVAVAALHTSPAQWQEMISKLVTDWYGDQNPFLRLAG